MAKASAHKWEFRARFRRRAFGWKSQPAIKRIKEAVAEIKKVAHKDKLLAAEGAVLFLEKVSPALEHVDSSSGAIGTAVNNAIAALVEVIASAPADEKTREKWLARLWEAYQDDQIPYIESLGDYWGELCVSKEIASRWADRLIGTCKMAWSPDPNLRGFFKGTTNCLSALLAAERHDELFALLEMGPYKMWHYRRHGAQALAVLGKKAEAIRYAEEGRGLNDSPVAIARACEEVLLSSGLADEAYERYGLLANQAGTYAAWFRAVAKKYPVPPQNLVDHAIVDVFALRVRLATLMRYLLCALLATARSSPRSQREIAPQNLAMRQQLAVLKRKTKRPTLTNADLTFWVALSRLWPDWQSALILVKRETVIGWHRKGFKLYWTWKSRNPRGCPRIDAEIQTLTRRIATENPTWGAPRVHGELLILGFDAGEASVSRYMPGQRSDARVGISSISAIIVAATDRSICRASAAAWIRARSSSRVRILGSFVPKLSSRPHSPALFGGCPTPVSLKYPRRSARPGERQSLRFPPPPLLETSHCMWLATSLIASDQIVTIVGSARRRFVEFGDGVSES
jgi:hypothetical protein